MNETINKILTDYDCFTNPSVTSEVDKLPDSEVRTLGQALVKELLSVQKIRTKRYAYILWMATAPFRPWLDKPLSVIFEKKVEESVQNDPRIYVCMNAKRLRKKMLSFALANHWNLPNGNDNLAGDLDDCLLKRKNEKNKQMCREFFRSISFAENYSVPDNVSFKTFMEYWLFKHRDNYNSNILINCVMKAYCNFAPLYDIPYKDVFPEDIERALEEKSDAEKRSAHAVYSKLEKFADFLGIIPKVRRYPRANTGNVEALVCKIPRENRKMRKERVNVKTLVENLSFPPNYQCPADISLKQLALYWIYVNREFRSKDNFVGPQMAALGYLKPWFEIPFRELSFKDIQKELEYASSEMRKRIRALLYRLDELADMQGVIKKSKNDSYTLKRLEITVLNNRNEKIRRRVNNVDYIESLAFPENFHCSKNMSLKSVLDYWLFTNRNKVLQERQRCKWMPAYKHMEQLWEKRFSSINYNEIEKISLHFSFEIKREMFALYRKLDIFAYEQGILDKRKSISNEKLERELTISMRNANGDLIVKALKNKEYFQRLYFPDDYVCKRNLRLKTVFDYWLFSHRDTFQDMDVITRAIGCFRSMKLLHQIPFNKIRKEDIVNLMRGKTPAMCNRIIGLYRNLDWFAYIQGIIPTCHAKGLKYKKLRKNELRAKVLDDAQIQILMQHKYEPGVDILLTALSTGAKRNELACLNKNQLEDNFLYLKNPNKRDSYRYIPLNNEQVSIVNSAIDTIQKIGCNTYKKAKMAALVKQASQRILGEPVTFTNCRETFDNRLLSNHYSLSFANYLRGTKQGFVSRTGAIYRHYDKESVLSMMEGRALYEL